MFKGSFYGIDLVGFYKAHYYIVQSFAFCFQWDDAIVLIYFISYFNFANIWCLMPHLVKIVFRFYLILSEIRQNLSLLNFEALSFHLNANLVSFKVSLTIFLTCRWHIIAKFKQSPCIFNNCRVSWLSWIPRQIIRCTCYYITDA